MTWSASNEPTEYKTGTTKFWYYIKTRDEDGVAPYRFQVFRRDANPVKLAEEFSVDQDEALAQKFAALHEQAFRSANGLRRELSEEILSDLDDIEPF
ncbi:hypothetical protein AVW09_00505 [Microbacterium sp. T32]|nr:hypothetical protein AVW09_00505 [Microbacterium sp. T32]